MESSLKDILPYLVRFENISRYEDGEVLIGDRSKYPFERAFVRCGDVESVAQAIEHMVTQGSGPRHSAVYAMAMVARQVERREPAEVLQHLEAARARLAATRPTNTSIARALARMMAVAQEALACEMPLEETLLQWIDKFFKESYDRMTTVACLGADLIEDGDGILTMCFAEAPFIMSLAIAAHQDGKRIRVYTPETRPYLQGARLTAPSVHELGIPVQIVTDNMPAYLMSQGKIQKYFTGSDLVTLDGHVVNKVGTFQNALAAHHHGVPYFAFSKGPDAERPDRASVMIEERDPAEVRACRGISTTSDEIPAYYPAFDVTPPYLVAGVITVHGVLSPYDLRRYYQDVSSQEER